MSRVITYEELKKHNNSKSLWISIHNKVYDVTKFKDEHPGGEEVLLEQAGRYASDPFDDVDHSAEAKDLMKSYLIGKMAEDSKEVLENKLLLTSSPVDSGKSSWFSFGISIVLAVLATYGYHYYSSSS